MLAPLRVVKLGGSLLSWPGLREAFRSWRAASPETRDLLSVGGGAGADWIREADRVHQLGDDLAHRLAIQAMQLNAELAIALWPEAQWCDDLAKVSTAPGTYVLRVWPALCDEQQRRFGEPLPHSWQVTSDSIAAWIAVALGADELVLLKSTLPNNPSLSAAMEAGYVDPHFPVIARDISRITTVDLRSNDFVALTLHAATS